MKRKYFIRFSVILIVLFSITAISAGEDVDLYSSANDSSDGNVNQILDNVETDANPTSSNPENVLSADDECDLSVSISVEKTYDGNKFNRKGSEIPWNITVEVNEGVARNVKVQLNFSSNMEYVSCNKTIGEYDSSTRIWNIGDLSSSQPAVLTILTRLSSDGHFNCTADATTDSIDVNMSNNLASKFTKSGTGNNGSNITQNSTDKNAAQHGPHLTTIIKPGEDPHIEPEKNKSKDGNSRNGRSNGVSSGGGSNGVSSRGGYMSSRYRSDTESASSKTLNPFSTAKSASSILGLEDSKVLNWISKHISKVIPPYDYTRIPIIIFSLFLLVLVGIVGYDKLKSQKK